MATNTYEEIKKMIREEVERLGPVYNLHGSIESRPITEAPGAAGQGWWLLSVPGSRLPTLTEFARAYTLEQAGYAPADGAEGAVRVRGTSGRVSALYTSVNLTAPTTIPIRARGSDGQIAIYVDQQPRAQASAEVSATVTLQPGIHSLFVLYTGEGEFTVTLPATVPCVRRDMDPTPPEWATRGEFEYLNEATGQMGIRLEWSNDPFASAWELYRAKAYAVATVSSATEQPDGRILIEWTGQAVPGEVGDTLRTVLWPAGRIVQVERDNDPDASYTRFWVVPSNFAPESAAEWVGHQVALPGTFRPVARIPEPGTDPVEYGDASAGAGGLYVYRLTAFSFVTGQIESEYSRDLWVLANDGLAPAAVRLDHVEIQESEIQVWYTAPKTADYAGLRVYGPFATDEPVVFSSAKRIAQVPGAAGASGQFRIAGFQQRVTYYFVSYDTIGNEQSVDLIETDEVAFFRYTNPDSDQTPEAVVTPSSLTAERLTISWNLNGDAVAIGGVGCDLAFLTGNPASATGVLNATRPAPGAPSGVAIFEAVKHGVAARYEVMVPAQDQPIIVPILSVRPIGSDRDSIFYRASAREVGTGVVIPYVTLRLPAGVGATLLHANGEREVLPRGAEAMIWLGDSVAVNRPAEGAGNATIEFFALSASGGSVSAFYEVPEERPVRGAVVLDLEERLTSESGKKYHELTLSALPGDAEITCQLQEWYTDDWGRKTYRLVNPPLTATGTPGVYTLRIAVEEEDDRSLTIRGRKAGLLTQVIAYSLGADLLPDVTAYSSKYVGDQTRVSATVDGDTKRVRFARVTTGPDGSEVFEYLPAGFGATGQDASVKKAFSVDVALRPGEKATIVIGVTVDPAGLVGWIEGARFEVRGPTVPNSVPLLHIDVIEPAGWDPMVETHLRLWGENPSGAALLFGYEIGGGDIQLTPNPVEIIVYRGDPANAPAGERVHVITDTTNRAGYRVRVWGRCVDTGMEDFAYYDVGWNEFAEIVAHTVAPWYQMGADGLTQIGWRVAGTVDDRTKSIKAQVYPLAGGTATIEGAALPKRDVLVQETASSKTFEFLVRQSAGQSCWLDLTPYPEAGGRFTNGKNGPGPTIRDTLSRPPTSTATVRAVSATEVEVSLSASPSNSAIRYRFYAEGTDPGALPAFATYSKPVRVLRGTSEDVVFEYRAEISGMAETPHVLRIDADDAPEVRIAHALEIQPGYVQISIDHDDDVTEWRLWSRTTKWPTTDGLKESAPEDLFLRYAGTTRMTSVEHRALTGTLNIIAIGYDAAGNPGPRATLSVPVTSDVVAGATPALIAPQVIDYQDPASGKWHHRLFFGTTDGINADWSGVRGLKMEVYRKVDSAPDTLVLSNRHPADDALSVPANTDPAHGSIFVPIGYAPRTSADSDAVYRRFNFTIRLLTASNQHLGTYTASMYSYYSRNAA